MSRDLDGLINFVQEVLDNNYSTGYTSYIDARRYTLHALGGRADESLSLEIWFENYEDTDRGDDKRTVYEIDIKKREIKNER